MKPPPDDAARLQELVLELQVHQTELQAQNEALLQAQQDIEQARESYTVLYDTAPVAYFTIDRNTMVQQANLTACKLLLQERHALVGRPLAPYVARPHRSVFRRYVLDCTRGGRQVVELTLVPQDRKVQVSSHLAPDRPGAILMAMMDITELTQVQTALAQTTASQRAVIKASNDAILITAGGNIESWNQAAGRMFGPGLAGRGLDQVILTGPDDTPVGVNPDGSQFPAEVSRASLPGGNRHIMTVRDVTRLRRIQEHVLEAVEMQRRQVGRDLHDSVSQHLAGIIMLAQTLERRIARGVLPDTDEASRVVELLQRTLRQTQELARGQYPAELQRQGLARALRALAQDCTQMFGVPCAVTASAIPVTNAIVAIHLYRFAQEAISNAMKHGAPTGVQVRWQAQGPRVKLEILDDGRGFDPDQVVSGMGLSILRHRAMVMNATFTLISRPGAGTTVACAISRRQLDEESPPTRRPTTRPNSKQGKQ